MSWTWPAGTPRWSCRRPSPRARRWAPARVEDLGPPEVLLRQSSVVNHDGHRDEDMVTLGVTARGTPVRVHRCVVEAAVAPLVEPGGTLGVVAECAAGVGPLGVVNEAIIRIGVRPRLAPGVTLRLVSSLPPAEVARTLFAGAESGAALLASQAGSITIVPRASQLIWEAA